jgi:hypothetical protein
MEAAVPWKAAMKPRLPTGLGKRPPHEPPAFSTPPTAPATRKKENQSYEPTPCRPPIKCYLCSRSKVLPMFQVAQPKADEGAALGRSSLGKRPSPALRVSLSPQEDAGRGTLDRKRCFGCGYAALCLRGENGLLAARIERLAKSIADDVEGGNRQEDRDAGEQDEVTGEKTN